MTLIMRCTLALGLLLSALVVSGCDRPGAPEVAAPPTPTDASSAAVDVSDPVAAAAGDEQTASALPASFEALQPGADYTPVTPAPADSETDAPITVAEAFSYACSHCADFEPQLAAWRAALPDDVAFEAVPMPLNPVWTEFARGFYAATDTGVIDRSHALLFEAIHARGARIDSVETLVQWYVDTVGADAASFTQAMASSATESRIADARARAERWGITGTPTLVIDGRYAVPGFPEASGGFARTLAVADLLIAELRRKRAAAG